MPGNFLTIGGALGFLGVGLGAFGTHALKARLAPGMLEVWQTAVAYQIWHALALLAVALAARQIAGDSPWLQGAGWAFAAGTVVFSGSLYLLVLSGAKWWGMVTPLGGLMLLAGWLAVVVAGLRSV